MLVKIGDFVQRFHKMILAVSLAVTFVMIFFMSRLQMNMQFTDILPKTEKTVITYKNALKNFDTLDSIVVAVKGKEKNIKKFLEERADEIEGIEGIRSVNYENQVEFLEENIFLLMKDRDLENIEKALTASNLKDFFAGINDSFEREYIDESDSGKIDKDRVKLLNSLNFLEETISKIRDGKISREDAKKFVRGERYILSPDKSMGILMIKSGVSIDDFENVIKVVNNLEEYLEEESEKYNVKIRMTGLQVLSRDEMVISQRDMEISSTLSLLLVLGLFTISFKMIRYSLLSLVPLITGIIWTMGLTYIIIGTLNMMTAMMGAIIIGLGIDYSIHIISLFIEERGKGLSIEEAVTSVYSKTMRGVVTGAGTTAIGFFMFTFSDFPGFQEFGLVLGMGIICTLASAVFVLPSLLIVYGGKGDVKKSKMSLLLSKTEGFVIGRRKSSLLIVVFIMIVLGSKAGRVEFENDMLKIEPKNLQSVALNREIIDKFDFSSDNTIIVSETLEETQEVFERADKLKSIGMISSVTSYLPSEKIQILRTEAGKLIKEKIKNTPDSEIYTEELTEELVRLENNLLELGDLSYIGGEEKIRERCDEIIESGLIGELVEGMSQFRKNIEKSQKIFIGELQGIIRKSNTDKIIGLEDLPDEIRDEFVGKDGTYISSFYPKKDIWKSDFQKIHMKEIETLGEDVTGSSKIFLRVIEKSATEGKKILVLTLVAIYFILVLDFKSFKYATAAILPMVFSVLGTLGIMGWTGFKFDMVNIIGIPLIIGIGVDDGVHIIHRYLGEKDIFKAVRSTGKSVTLTTVTTIAAFGTLMLARYRGFVHFGILLTIGVGFAYLLTMTLLVSLISIVDGIEKNVESDEL
ncbi:MMPL family transporter [uncultured Ilyobacter sp.]|uniref:efflux RND transporter permease subunit n=1 Tax=uncultured Ilyobacter sp. TaxID=544433 RepID=UPI0029C8E4E3|nr:MMPL family transporter [uncultured Ilyobacter sp.]